MTDYKTAPGPDKTTVWYERMETRELLAVVDRALGRIGNSCQVCGGNSDSDKRLVSWLYHHKMLHCHVLLEMACPECDGL